MLVGYYSMNVEDTLLKSFIWDDDFDLDDYSDC